MAVWHEFSPVCGRCLRYRRTKSGATLWQIIGQDGNILYHAENERDARTTFDALIRMHRLVAIESAAVR